MPPEEVLWDYEQHTAAKHRILIRYLQAWLPIMASRNRRLNLIDGFAGPGRYKGGEPGSPLLMLDAYLSHSHRTRMAGLELFYDFIESDPRRVANLRSELAALTLPPNVHVEVTEGEFEIMMSGMLDAIPAGSALVPTFAFIDPFGYTGHGLHLSSRILAFGRCEVLIYVPLPFIARFINEPGIERALDNLYGDNSWKAARAQRGRQAEVVLHDTFLARVEAAAGFARSFEIDSGGRGWTGYDLFFGTGNLRGLEKFKEAMWSVDPTEGSKFVDSTNPNQLTLLGGPDLRALEGALSSNFGTREFTIEQAETFVIRSTPFVPSAHLKTKTLKPAEYGGRLEARHPTITRRRGTYPDGTLLRFKPPVPATP